MWRLEKRKEALRGEEIGQASLIEEEEIEYI
jgi:hypothetical protein